MTCPDVQQRTTTYYSVLQRTTMYYNVLQRTTTYYNILQRTTTYYNVLQRTTAYYNVLQRTTTYYNVLQGLRRARARLAQANLCLNQLANTVCVRDMIHIHICLCGYMRICVAYVLCKRNSRKELAQGTCARARARNLRKQASSRKH